MARLFFSLPQHAFFAPDIEVWCRTAQQLFLALDYGGTLVPSAPYPEVAYPTPALRALLAQLAQTPRVKVVVVSGRPLSDLCAVLPVRGIAYIGTHGLELRTATGETRYLIPPGAFTTVMARLRQDLASLLIGTPGLLLENKRQALALHYYLARPEERERAMAQLLAVVRRYQRKGFALEVIQGHRVVEVRPLGVSKGRAVQALLEPEDNTTLVLYMGDDLTDEDAFQVLNARGFTVLVANPPRPTAARYYLRDPEEVECFLFGVLSLRQNVEGI
jgi:trehalose-phosphatase